MATNISLRNIFLWYICRPVVIHINYEQVSDTNYFSVFNININYYKYKQFKWNQFKSKHFCYPSELCKNEYGKNKKKHNTSNKKYIKKFNNKIKILCEMYLNTLQNINDVAWYIIHKHYGTTVNMHTIMYAHYKFFSMSFFF